MLKFGNGQFNFNDYSLEHKIENIEMKRDPFWGSKIESYNTTWRHFTWATGIILPTYSTANRPLLCQARLILISGSRPLTLNFPNYVHPHWQSHLSFKSTPHERLRNNRSLHSSFSAMISNMVITMLMASRCHLFNRPLAWQGYHQSHANSTFFVLSVFHLTTSSSIVTHAFYLLLTEL